MKPLVRNFLFASTFAMMVAPLDILAQSLPAAPSIPGLPPVPTSLEDRRKALDQLEHDYWEDILKHNPELASAVGDTRFNDQVSNYTSGAYNDAISREQGYLMQLAVIDLAGFTDDEKHQAEALDKRFEEAQKAASSKPWELPINADDSFYAVYPQLAQTLRFATVKDYDDWTARLRALPEAFAQVLQDMSLGVDDGRVPPKDLLEKALADVSTLAHQKLEESPLTAPLKKFSTSVSPAEQERIKQEMNAAYNNDAQGAYLRLERFLRVSYLPAAGPGPASAGTRESELLFAVLDLRAKAQQALGPKFDVKAFHDEMLKTGLLPVDEMQKQVEAWITNAGK